MRLFKLKLIQVYHLKMLIAFKLILLVEHFIMIHEINPLRILFLMRSNSIPYKRRNFKQYSSLKLCVRMSKRMTIFIQVLNAYSCLTVISFRLFAIQEYLMKVLS